jgi:DNA (cytosine-5)-methyltransferase 1
MVKNSPPTSNRARTNDSKVREGGCNPKIFGVDLFCGAGGLTHGLSQSGINVVAGIDFDEACRFPYEKNNDAAFIHKDIAKVSAAQVKSLLDKGGFTLLAGCAPCQPFSNYSQSARKMRQYPDWGLVLSFGKLIERVRPDLVTMENVPELSKHPVFAKFLATLHGYHVDWKIVECEEIGIPQTRSRLVLVASRKGSITIDLPRTRKKATVREAIGRLPRVNAGEQHNGDPLHISSSLSRVNLRRIRASKPGGTWRDWASSLRAECHKRKSGRTYCGVYGRMEWDKPAPTITTQCFGFGNGRFGHPDQDRAITLREAALIQSFPRRYAFSSKDDRVNMKSLGRLIGNAVPVRLGKLIGAVLVDHVSKLEPKSRKRSKT